MNNYAELREAVEAAIPGPWYVQSSNSWRRIGTQGGDGDVLAPTTQTDGHPDLAALHETLAYIAAANPKVIRALLAERDALREALVIIATTHQIEAMLDPQRAVRIARAALAQGKS